LVHERNVSFWRLVEFDGEPHLLLEIERRVHLLRMNDGRAEIAFLGPLDGATYEEKVEVDDRSTAHFVATFRHSALPGPIELRATSDKRISEPRLWEFRSWLRDRASAA
jgi:hypothetical protein